MKLEEVLRHRKEVITIDELTSYKRPRVRLHVQGIVLRDEVPGALIKTKTQQVCRAGEFLVAEIDAKVGGFGIVPEPLNGSIVSSHYFLFVIDEAKLDRRFLDFFIRTPAFREQVAAQGSTNYAAIRPSHVLGYQIPLPPLTEQRRAVARIEELAAQIHEARTLRHQTGQEGEALWSSGLNSALTGQLRDVRNGDRAIDLLSDAARRHSATTRSKHNNAHPHEPQFLDTGPVAIPSHWQWTTLGSVLSCLIDCVNDTPDFVDAKTGLFGLKSTNIRPYKLDLSRHWYMSKSDFDTWNRRERPVVGDIVLTREAPMGYACILPPGDFCLTQRLLLLRCDPAIADSRFVLHYLNSSLFAEQVSEHSRGLTTPHIRVKDAPQFLFPLPPLAAQRRIVAELDALQTEVDALKRLQAETATELDALLPAILDKAFKGEL